MKIIRVSKKVDQKKKDSGPEMKLARDMYHLFDDVEDKISGIKKMASSLSKEDAEYLVGYLSTNETKAEDIVKTIKSLRENLKKIK